MSRITTLDALLDDWKSNDQPPIALTHRQGKSTSQVVGTGRYMIEEHVQDQYAVFLRNEIITGVIIQEKRKTLPRELYPRFEPRYSALVSGEIMGLMDNGANYE